MDFRHPSSWPRPSLSPRRYGGCRVETGQADPRETVSTFSHIDVDTASLPNVPPLPERPALAAQGRPCGSRN